MRPQLSAYIGNFSVIAEQPLSPRPQPVFADRIGRCLHDPAIQMSELRKRFALRSRIGEAGLPRLPRAVRIRTVRRTASDPIAAGVRGRRVPLRQLRRRPDGAARDGRHNLRLLRGRRRSRGPGERQSCPAIHHPILRHPGTSDRNVQEMVPQTMAHAESVQDRRTDQEHCRHSCSVLAVRSERPGHGARDLHEGAQIHERRFQNYRDGLLRRLPRTGSELREYPRRRVREDERRADGYARTVPVRRDDGIPAGLSVGLSGGTVPAFLRGSAAAGQGQKSANISRKPSAAASPATTASSRRRRTSTRET